MKTIIIDVLYFQHIRLFSKQKVAYYAWPALSQIWLTLQEYLFLFFFFHIQQYTYIVIFYGFVISTF